MNDSEEACACKFAEHNRTFGIRTQAAPRFNHPKWTPESLRVSFSNAEATLARPSYSREIQIRSVDQFAAWIAVSVSRSAFERSSTFFCISRTGTVLFTMISDPRLRMAV